MRRQVIGAMVSSAPQIMTVRQNAVTTSQTKEIRTTFSAHTTITNAWLGEEVVLRRRPRVRAVEVMTDPI